MHRVSIGLMLNLCSHLPPSSYRLTSFKASRSWHNLSVIPQPCRSECAKLCSYHGWFGRPAHVLRQGSFLCVSVNQLQEFRFRMGVNGLLIDAMWLPSMPHHRGHCDLFYTGGLAMKLPHLY